MKRWFGRPGRPKDNGPRTPGHTESDQGFADDGGHGLVGGVKILDLGKTRRKALQFLLEYPGAPAKEVSIALGVSRETAGAHLRWLCANGLAKKIEKGRVAFYHPGEAIGPKDRAWLLLAFESPDCRSVIDHLVKNQGNRQTVNKVVRELGSCHGLVLRVLRKLKTQGLVEVVTASSWTYVHATPTLASYWNELRGGQWEKE